MRKSATLALAGGLVLAACVVVPQVADAPMAKEAAAQVQAPRYDLGRPYIGGPLPGGESLIHPPPEAGSTRMTIDEEANARSLSLRGSPRWEQAARDADLGENWYGRAFSCAAGVRISPEATPRIANLLRRAGTDFGMSTGAVKDVFKRPRPFTVNGSTSCTPQEEEALRGNGSYPSGHSAIGYGTALVLASLLPDRAAELAKRGRGYANSRWVCNVHWYSDTVESQAFAGATFARLQSNPDFQADYAAAREEAASLAPAPIDEICAAEAENPGA